MMSITKRITALWLVLAFLNGFLPILGSQQAEASGVMPQLPTVVSSVYEDYESKSVGDALLTSGNYQLTVQQDPSEAGNKVARQLYGSTAPSGYTPTMSFTPLTGTFVLDQKVRLDGSGNNLYYVMYMRTQSGNIPVPIWRIHYPGSNPGLYLTKANGSGEENVVPANLIQTQVWYAIRTVINTSTATYDIYLLDQAGNRLYGSTGRHLPTVIGATTVDYSAGFKWLYGKHSGSTLGYAATYSDDLFLYTMSAATQAEFLVDNAEIGRNKAEITYADGKVAALAAGTVKTNMQMRLSALRTGMVAQASAAVYTAEQSELEADLAAAQALLRELPDDEDISTLQTRVNALARTINHWYLNNDYQLNSLNSIVFNQNNYDVRVQEDADGTGNHVAKMTFGQVPTSGFWGGSSFASPIKGTVLYEKSFRFEGTGTGMYHLQTIRTQDGNQSVNLFRIQAPGNSSGVYVGKADGSAGEDRLAIGSIVNDRWYRIIVVMHLEEATYDIHIIDSSSSEVIESSLGRHLLIKNANTQPIDYTLGIKSMAVRITGTAASYGDAALYMDNEHMYGNTSSRIAAHVQSLLDHIREETIYYSSSLKQRMMQAIVLYPERAYSYVRNKRKMISTDHPDVRPELVNGIAMASVQFLANQLGWTGSWNESQTIYTVTYGGTTLQLNPGLPTMTVNGVLMPLDHPTVHETNALQVPIGNVGQVFGLTLFQDNARGVWVLDANPNLFDPINDAALLDELNKVRFGIRPPTITVNTTAAEPSGVSAQQSEFNDRNSAASVEQLARRLASVLDPTVPGLIDFRQRVTSEDYEGALMAFRSYFLNKLRNINTFNWDQELLSFTFGKGDSMPDELLYNILTTPDMRKILIGEPGRIDWRFEAPATNAGYASRNNYMWHIDQFYPLLNRFNSSGNLSYLDKWGDYVDDWALHSHGYDSILPAEIPDADQAGARAVVYLMRQLKLLADHLPADGEGLPATTLARVLIKMQEEYPPISIVYGSSNPQNWTTGIFTSLIMNGLLLSEFKDSSFYLREGFRRMEDFGTTHYMPDGTESEQSLSYNREDLRYGAGLAYQVVKTLRPDLMTPEREAEIKERLMARAKLMSHALNLKGKFPAGFRIDWRDWTATVKELLQDAIPEALQDSNIAAILAIGSGSPTPAEPDFTSEWFPYGGYSFIRSGWMPDSQEAFLFSSSHPGNYGYHSLQGNNMLSIQAFGQDMVVPGEVGAYDNIPSPLTVDGDMQNYSYGISSWGHRQTLVSSWDEPADLRWYESPSFQFTEGMYEGHYGKDEGTGTDDTAHQRMLTLLQEQGLWIVTDRLISGGTHNYRMDLRLPSQVIGSRSPGYRVFDPTHIERGQSDARSGYMRTQDPGVSNLSVYQFGSSAMTTTGTVEIVASTNLYKVSDFYRLSASFSGSGDQALVSVIYPRQTQQAELLSIEPRNGSGVAGFKAIMSDGKVVQYQVAADKNEVLSLESVSIQGEALLLLTDANGVTKGMALGVSVMSESGIPQNISFEFEIRNGVMQQLGSINKPVGEVSITPGADVFVDYVTVTMATYTAGASIRYTLDGSTPTLSSALYTGPFMLTDSAKVKARAFRAGVMSVKDTIDSTNVSSVRTATFTKQALRQAVSASTVSGVVYRYYAGDWKDLMVHMDRMDPTSLGTASGLFDFSAKATDGAYGFEYSGWLDIPSDGVYTFRAPEEWLLPNIMAGYDLQLFIGDERWYPITGRQGFGTWSIALEHGLHRIQVRYVDYRGQTVAAYNIPNLTPRIWEGVIPNLTISGPNMTEQAVPSSMLRRKP
ncbi:chitobiase/beta-hexosaminidase C-terminal domain-containing protein [Paenibacillus sp. HWE-109]|uniref:chitobiase/beta-hexosaminidase C-terminal domain-containing protein n=1 Tax=Paenibacillus sp. HWE-109 TaxID=1306526 RepID=UPI001EDF5CF2|nr:chitobiase/beta-hexosaminidase C-terminal domain-containing protein [Paenibacillus sp. HWE-109]UKS27896.1 chitobiase/beta-hexosaminidase C-terminal domain-containing protein [Paenibacillus sp. HWE-109]